MQAQGRENVKGLLLRFDPRDQECFKRTTSTCYKDVPTKELSQNEGLHCAHKVLDQSVKDVIKPSS